MEYHNLKITLSPKQDVKQESTYEKLGDLIAFSMLQDEKLKNMHKEKRYKNYVYCNLYPIEKDGIYKVGKIYTFDIHFIDLKVAMKIKQILTLISSQDFKILMSQIQTNTQRKIHKLITLTPAILTNLKGDYSIEDNLLVVKERILANVQKKYFQLYQTKVEIDFIQEIKKTNRTPIKIPYKNIAMLGNKFEITVKEDPMSQNLAYLIMAVGLLEKNSVLGAGFCKAI